MPRSGSFWPKAGRIFIALSTYCQIGLQREYTYSQSWQWHIRIAILPQQPLISFSHKLAQVPLNLRSSCWLLSESFFVRFYADRHRIFAVHNWYLPLPSQASGGSGWEEHQGPCPTRQWRSGSCFLFSVWKESQVPQCLWEMVLFVPGCPSTTPFHLIFLGFWVHSQEFHPLLHHQAGICFPCITPVCPVTWGWAISFSLHLLMGKSFLKDLALHLTILHPNNPPFHHLSCSLPEAPETISWSCSPVSVVPLILTTMKWGSIF